MARDAVLAAARPDRHGTRLDRRGARSRRRGGGRRPHVAAAVAEFGDGRLRDPGRGHRRGRWRRRRRASTSSARSAPASRRGGGPTAGRPSASRPARACPTAPTPSSRSKPTTPLDSDGRPGPRGRDATGPLPAADRRPRGRPCRAARSGRPAATSRRAPRSSRRVTRSAPPRSPCWPARASRPSSVHRRPRVAVLATGDEVRAPGEPLGPAGIPDANGPGLRALATAAGADVIDLGHRDRRARGRPGAPASGPRPTARTRSSSRVASRSGRSTS